MANTLTATIVTTEAAGIARRPVIAKVALTEIVARRSDSAVSKAGSRPRNRYTASRPKVRGMATLAHLVWRDLRNGARFMSMPGNRLSHILGTSAYDIGNTPAKMMERMNDIERGANAIAHGRYRLECSETAPTVIFAFFEIVKTGLFFTPR